MTQAVHRTILTVEVFSSGPLEDDASLSDIAYAIEEGDCVGKVTRESSAPVAPEELEAHLIRIGNDGSFFDWAEEADDEL